MTVEALNATDGGGWLASVVQGLVVAYIGLSLLIAYLAVVLLHLLDRWINRTRK